MLSRFKSLATVVVRPTPTVDGLPAANGLLTTSQKAIAVDNTIDSLFAEQCAPIERPGAPVTEDQIGSVVVLRRLLGACRRVSQSVGSDLDSIRRTLTLECVALLNCQHCRVFVRAESGAVADDVRAGAHEGIVGHVLNTGQTMQFSKGEIERNGMYVSGVDSCPDQRNPKSALYVPLCCTLRGKLVVVGVIQAQNKAEANGFTGDDVVAISVLADTCAEMIQSGRQLNTTTQLMMTGMEAHARSEAMLQVARALSNETTITGIVSLITHKVQQLLAVERCTLFLVDPMAAHDLVIWKEGSTGIQLSFADWVRGVTPAPDLPFTSNSREIRMPMEKAGIAGHVVRTGEKLCIRDLYADARFNPEWDRQTGFTSRNMLCMPLRTFKGEIVGVIEAINKDARKESFNEGDEDLLETFAAHAAIAIGNYRLLDGMKRNLAQSDAILEVTNALSKELKLGSLVEIIVRKVQNLLNVERCTVFICDRAKDDLFTTSSMSFGDGLALPIPNDTEDIIRIPMSAGIAGHVATTGETLVIPDAYADKRFNNKMDLETGFRTRNILCMAIQDHKSEIVGVIQVINKRQGQSFLPDDIKQLQAFTAQAAVAISNCRLFQETERALNHALRQVRNLKFMLSVTKNLSSELQTSNLMTQMQTQLNDLLKADHCFFFVVETDKALFYRLDNGAESERYTLDRGIAGHVARTGKPAKIQSRAHEDDRFDCEVDSNGRTCESMLCMPIMAQGESNQTQVIGLISVQDETDRGGFGKEEETLLKVFCAQASVALVNSKKFMRVIEDASSKQEDFSANEYLTQDRGMQLGSHEIDRFAYTVDEIHLNRCIGKGSYGEVWLARARNEVVAVKKIFTRNLKGEQIDAFCSEASLMCQLKHPNVIEFKGAITQPPDLCIVTEYCSRGSLADLLMDRSYTMTNRTEWQFIRDIAQGMHYLHTSNPVILHRDLKTDNLLVDRNWVVKVADFGLTRFLDEKKQMTQVGTPIWMSPEVCMGDKYTEKADVYAFGIIMWEIMTRQEPYHDKETMQIVLEVVNNGLRPYVSDRLKARPLYSLMTDCWHQQPERRPNFKAILERLDSPDIVAAMANDIPVQY